MSEIDSFINSLIIDLLCKLCIFVDLMNLILWLLEPDLTHRATIFDMQCDVWTHQPVIISHYKFHEIFSKDSTYR